MVSAPWELTDEMFLDEDEASQLCTYLDRKVDQSDGSTKVSAIVDRVIIETLLFSGLRNTEFCRLQVADTIVGLSQSVIRVTDDQGNGRIVHVPRSVSELIESYVTETRPSCLPEGIAPKDLHQPLVLNERGNIYDRTALYRRVVRILSGANLEERASVQLLRHSYGYLAYKRTCGNLLFVQQQLGHSHPMVTAVYSQFVEHPPDKLAELVGGSMTLRTIHSPMNRKSTNKAKKRSSKIKRKPKRKEQ